MAWYMHIYGVIGGLYVCGLALSPPVFLLFVLFFLIRPFSEGLYLRAACMVQGTYLTQLVFMLENIARIKLVVTGEFPPREPALVLSNHLTQEWTAMYMMAFRRGTLNYVRTVVKKSASYLPGFGWAMGLCYWPFVSRDFKRDEKELEKLFTAYRSQNLPVQLWSYPEGTRATPQKLKESQEYAKANGYPVFKHVMLPRYRGFVMASNALKNIVQHIHEVTIQYEGWGGVPSFWQLLTPDPFTKHVIHVHINRVPMSSLPEDEKGKQQWLIDSFARKDELLEHFFKKGSFPGRNLAQPYSLVRMLSYCAFWFVVTILFWTTVYHLWF